MAYEKRTIQSFFTPVAKKAKPAAEAPAAAPTKTPRTDEILLSSSDKENGVRQRTGRQVDSPVSDE